MAQPPMRGKRKYLSQCSRAAIKIRSGAEIHHGLNVYFSQDFWGCWCTMIAEISYKEARRL
jgi:hypothetical protein